MCVRLRVSMCMPGVLIVCVCLYVRVCARKCVRACVYMYIYTHTYTHIHLHTRYCVGGGRFVLVSVAGLCVIIVFVYFCSFLFESRSMLDTCL